ncbi:hypothetical protein EDB85DRAFT_743793 [Lactarius pseudohatsudake]|nr:hypothetical protein EDB85DRAFT_743793 [Lactarius pseudohatsudake]
MPVRVERTMRLHVPLLLKTNATSAMRRMLAISSIRYSVWRYVLLQGEDLALSPSPKDPWVVVLLSVLPGETSSALRYQSRTEGHESRQVQGCWYQMLSYETLLDLKRNVIKARQNCSNLPESAVPAVRQPPSLFNMAIAQAIAPKSRVIYKLRRRRGTRCKALPPVREGNRLGSRLVSSSESES